MQQIYQRACELNNSRDCDFILLLWFFFFILLLFPSLLYLFFFYLFFFSFINSLAFTNDSELLILHSHIITFKFSLFIYYHVLQYIYFFHFDSNDRSIIRIVLYNRLFNFFSCSISFLLYTPLHFFFFCLLIAVFIYILIFFFSLICILSRQFK